MTTRRGRSTPSSCGRSRHRLRGSPDFEPATFRAARFLLRISCALVLLLPTGSLCGAEVLVLKNGQRLQVRSYEVQGTLVIFETPEGGRFSLLRDEVDLPTTRSANAPAPPGQSAPSTPGGVAPPAETRAREEPARAPAPTPATPPAAAPAPTGLPRGSFRPLPLGRDDHNRLVCYARQPPEATPSRQEQSAVTPSCAAIPPLRTADLLSLIEKTCAPTCRIDRDAPAVVFIGLSASTNRSIFVVAPTRSGIPFDPLGNELPRADRLTAVSITDFSEGLIGSIELSVSERGRAVYRDSFAEPDPTRPQGLAGRDRRVAVLIAPFDIPHTPGALSIEFVETDVATLQRRSKAATFEAPAYHPVNFDLGFLVPFNTVSVDRFSLRRYTPESLQKIEGEEVGARLIFEEQARSYAYLTGTLNMTGIREKALEGEIGILRPFARSGAGRMFLRTLWPDIVFGVGVPAVQSRFFKDNSFFIGAGWRLGSNRVRLTWGYQFTTLEVLRSPYITGEFVPDALPESDVIERRGYHSVFWGVSFSLVSFGRDSL